MECNDKSKPTVFPTVKVENVSVDYLVPTKQSRSGKRLFYKLLGILPRIHVRAVKSVSFEAYTGDAIGLVGMNGSGKSTLLRVIAGLETPASGHVTAVEQPVLLGVSAALVPTLTGRENIRLGCLAMGLTPDEVNLVIPDVVELASIGDAIDLPMNSYSSGMSARLRFAIATATSPNILLIDEALATGDASFKEKSKRKMDALRNRAGTLFLVSHSISTVRSMCNRIIWLHKGEIVADGLSEDIAPLYEKWSQLNSNDNASEADDFLQQISQGSVTPGDK